MNPELRYKNTLNNKIQCYAIENLGNLSVSVEYTSCLHGRHMEKYRQIKIK